MNTSMKAALAATLVMGTAQAAHADLTLNGAVGLPLNPTAQVPNLNGVRVQADYFDMKTAGANFKFYGLHAAGSPAENVEINGGVERLRDPVGAGIGKTGIAIGAKYLFTRETDPAGVRIAAGAGYSNALLRNAHGYVVASKYLGAITGERQPVIGHLGVRYDRFTIPGGGGRSNRASVYAGAEVPVTPNGAFSVLGEVQSKNNDFGGAKVPFSAAVRFRPVGQGFSVTVGVARQGLINTGGKMFAQLGYTFATGAAGAGTTGTTGGVVTP